MPKPLNETRPHSSIADLVPPEAIEQATGSFHPDQNPTSVEVGVDTPVESPSAPISNEPQRTGEATNVQKLFRLTPSAYDTIQQLRQIFGDRLGYVPASSVVTRSILIAAGRALPDIEAAVQQAIPHGTGTAPPTAIGNEHARDRIEQQMADAICMALLETSSLRPS